MVTQSCHRLLHSSWHAMGQAVALACDVHMPTLSPPMCIAAVLQDDRAISRHNPLWKVRYFLLHHNLTILHCACPYNSPFYACVISGLLYRSERNEVSEPQAVHVHAQPTVVEVLTTNACAVQSQALLKSLNMLSTLGSPREGGGI